MMASAESLRLALELAALIQKGDPGPQGGDGKAGLDGVMGLPGKDGRDGTDGKDGAEGKAGPVGPQGLPGFAHDDAVALEAAWQDLKEAVLRPRKRKVIRNAQGQITGLTEG